MDRKHISSGNKEGQIFMLCLFAAIFSILAVMTLITNNYYYLLMILFAIIFFSPVYMFSLKLFDISFDGEYFYIENLLHKSIKINKNEFKDVVPMPTLPIINNPYFLILFKSGKKYGFSSKMANLTTVFTDRKVIAGKLKEEILQYVKDS